MFLSALFLSKGLKRIKRGQKLGSKMANDLQNALNNLQQFLEYERDEGVRAVEVSPEVMKSFHKMPTSAGGEQISDPPAHEKQSPSAKTDSSQKTAPALNYNMDDVIRKITACRKCSLHETRTNTVPGQGSSNPEIMFVGEAPGGDEDRQGLAFVGKAGQLLTKMINAMGYQREEVFIGNILKCRPPDNRTPLPDEMETCMPYLKAQIKLLQPKVIIALGSVAAKGLLDTAMGITKIRGKWMTFEGIDLMPTYHPAYLLRNPSAKRDVWNDLKAVLAHLGRKPPEN
jgi:DNA polymerase